MNHPHHIENNQPNDIIHVDTLLFLYSLFISILQKPTEQKPTVSAPSLFGYIKNKPTSLKQS
jgi:hypothetical protein